MTNENIISDTIVGKFNNMINLTNGIIWNKDNIDWDTIYRYKRDIFNGIIFNVG